MLGHSSRHVALLVAGAFLLRLLFLAVFHLLCDLPIEYQHDGEAEHFARRLVAGEGFTSPYVSDRVLPSALRAPVHPILLAGCFRAASFLGCRDHLPFYAMMTLVSSATVVPMWFLARRLFGRTVALLACFLSVVYAPSIYYATNATCDATLLAGSLPVLALCTLALQSSSTWRRAAWVGIVFGFCALINPIVLVVLAGYLPFLLAKLRRAWVGRLAALGTVGLLCLLTVSPWLIRNRLVFSRWVFLRTGFGLNMRLANHGEGESHILPVKWDVSKPPEVDYLREMGEVDYDRFCLQRSREWIAQDPGRFASLTLERIGVFWGKESIYGQFPAMTIPLVAVPCGFREF